MSGKLLLADVLTKPFSGVAIRHVRTKMGVMEAEGRNHALHTNVGFKTTGRSGGGDVSLVEVLVRYEVEDGFVERLVSVPVGVVSAWIDLGIDDDRPV